MRRALVKLKDRVPVQQKAGVIYRIPCKDCSKVYVGQTCRTLAHWMNEHKQALTSDNLAHSAVAEHAAQHSHAIDWEGAIVMDVEQQFHQRCILESLHIQSETSAMNRDEGNLPPVYDLLIHRPHSSTSEHYQFYYHTFLPITSILYPLYAPFLNSALSTAISCLTCPSYHPSIRYQPCHVLFVTTDLMDWVKTFG